MTSDMTPGVRAPLEAEDGGRRGRRGRPAPAPVDARRPRRPRRSPKRRRNTVRMLVFLSPAVAFLLAASLYPLTVLVRMSVSRVGVVNFLDAWPLVGLQNFRTLFASGQFTHAALITAQFLAVMLIATIIVGLLIALVLKFDSRLTRFTQSMLIMVWMTPPVIVGTLWKFLASSDGVVNAVLTGIGLLDEPVPVFAEPRFALWGVAAVALWMTLPFASLIIKAALLDVPRDLLEASRVDGAGALRALWHVVLPTIRPVLLIVAVLTIVYSFKTFEFIYVLTQGGPGNASTTLPYLGYIFAFQSYEFGLGGAVAVLCIGFTTIFAILYAIAIRREEAAQ